MNRESIRGLSFFYDFSTDFLTIRNSASFTLFRFNGIRVSSNGYLEILLICRIDAIKALNFKVIIIGAETKPMKLKSNRVYTINVRLDDLNVTRSFLIDR